MFPQERFRLFYTTDFAHFSFLPGKRIKLWLNSLKQGHELKKSVLT